MFLGKIIYYNFFLRFQELDGKQLWTLNLLLSSNLFLNGKYYFSWEIIKFVSSSYLLHVNYSFIFCY